MTDTELSSYSERVRENRQALEDTEEAFGSEDLHNLRLLETKIISEQGRRGMRSEMDRLFVRQVERMGQTFVDLLHDADGTRRNSPLFSSHELGRARDLIEEAVEIVSGVLRGRGA